MNKQWSRCQWWRDWWFNRSGFIQFSTIFISWPLQTCCCCCCCCCYSNSFSAFPNQIFHYRVFQMKLCKWQTATLHGSVLRIKRINFWKIHFEKYFFDKYTFEKYGLSGWRYANERRLRSPWKCSAYSGWEVLHTFYKTHFRTILQNNISLVGC